MRAPTVYIHTPRWAHAPTTQYDTILSREGSRSRNFVRQGAPEPADEGVYTYVEIAGEEQRRMTEFMPARLLAELEGV